MWLIKKFIFWSILLFLHACGNSSGKLTNTGQTIVVDNRQISSLDSIDRYVDTVELIQLESHPQGLIPDFVQGLLTGADRLFVMDDRNHTITVFDFTTGKFIRRIQPTGEGPGEYHSFRTATFNPFAAELEVFADFQRKVLVYSKDGVFLREEPQQLLHMGKTYLTADKCVYFCDNENSEYFGQDESYKIVAHNKKTNEWKFLQPLSVREAQQISLFSYYHFFNQPGSTANFFEPVHSYDILQVSAKEAKTRYRLKFTQNPLPEKYWEKNRKAIDEVLAAQENNFPFLPSYFFENSRLVVFPYSFYGYNFLFGYDKESGKAIFNTRSIGLSKWRFPMGVPNYAFQDGVLRLCSAKKFPEFLKNDPKRKYLPPAFFSIAKTLKPDDNPILMKVVFKNK